jgi:hypothetical protein
LYSSVAEPIGAINHQDNIRQWIMARQFNGYDYYAYLLGKDGVIDCPVISKSTLYIGKSTNPVSAQNDCAFSPNGDKFVSTYSTKYSTDIFVFNNYNGTLSNNVYLDNIRIPTGVQFSSNSRLLYVSEVQNSIIQFDMNSMDKTFILNNMYHIENTFNNKFDLQLSPNYELILIQQGSQFFGKIESPNIKDSLCNYILKGIPLGKAKWRYGLPNFNYSYFYTPAVDFSYIQDCKSNIFSFAAKDSFAVTDFQWHFTNKNRSYTAFGREISQDLSDTGIWLVQLVAGNKQRRDTLTKSIEVFPLVEKNFLGNDTGYCSGQKFNLILRTYLTCTASIGWAGRARL